MDIIKKINVNNIIKFMFAIACVLFVLPSIIYLFKKKRDYLSASFIYHSMLSLNTVLPELSIAFIIISFSPKVTTDATYSPFISPPAI